MKKHSLIATGIIFGLLATSTVFAASQLSCEQLNNTNWSDTADFQFGHVSLAFTHMQTNPFHLDFTIKYYGGNFEFGNDTPSCAIQTDGSLLIRLHQDSCYLVLQTDDLKTFQVLPLSKLESNSGSLIAVQGPFVRVS